MTQAKGTCKYIKKRSLFLPLPLDLNFRLSYLDNPPETRVPINRDETREFEEHEVEIKDRVLNWRCRRREPRKEGRKHEAKAKT